jgi:hypothetical protein
LNEIAQRNERTEVFAPLAPIPTRADPDSVIAGHRTRTRIFSALIFGLLLMVVGHGDNPKKTKVQVSNNLKSAQALRIRYMVGGAWQGIMISEQPRLKKILDAITVSGVQEDMQAAIEPVCQVIFILKDGKMMETSFVKADQLDQSFWGQIYLADKNFYTIIETIISEKEGKRIDLFP